MCIRTPLSSREQRDCSGLCVTEILTSDVATENDAVDENVQTAEEATEATEVNAGSGEDVADIAQTGVYTEHVFTDPLGVQDTIEGSPAFQPRYAHLFIT